MTDLPSHDSDADSELPPMTVAEIRAILKDESHPRHEEARRRSAEMMNELRPAIEKLSTNVASQVNTRETMDMIRGQHYPALAKEIMDPKRYELPSAHVVDFPAIASNELAEGMAEAMEVRADRERRQDDTAEASLEATQAVAAQMQRLNEKMADVERRLETGNKSAGRLGWATLIAAVLSIIASVLVAVFT